METMETLRWDVGEVQITRVEERIVAVPWHALVPDGEQLIDRCRPWMDPFVSTSGSHLLLSVHSFVVRTPETVAVIDTCVGDSGEFKMPGDPGFGERLAAELPSGFNGVDVVVCTHLHFDHVGWNTVEIDGTFAPRFGSARYLVTQAELDADRDEEDTRAWQRSIEPLQLAGCLDIVAPTHQIDPWLSLEPSPGHTPGHVSVRVRSSESLALITGDMVHTPLQFAHPTASSTPDDDLTGAIETRQRYIDELCDSEVLVLGSHFAPPTAGYLQTRPGGVAFI